MITKTVHLNDDIHLKLCKVQLELKEIGIEKTLFEINDILIRYVIKNAYEIIKNNKNKGSD